MRRLQRWLATGLLLAIAVVFAYSQQDSGGAETPLSTGNIKDYEQARKVFWQQLYKGEFTTLYCGESYPRLPSHGVNIEHVFPMGWVTHALNCGTRKQCRSNPQFNAIEADLHNLFPSRSDVNEERGSLRFGDVPGEARMFGRACDFEVSHNSRIVEPRPQVRGDIARAMFYMQDRYRAQGLTIYAKQAALLKRWHALDPPDQYEMWRNNTIEQLQGNRNPFIDDPESL